MRRLALALASALAVSALPALPAAALADEPLRVERERLVDEHGREVILHGMNVVYKVPPYLPNGRGERTSFDAADARRLRRWGFNTIRLGVTWKALMPARGRVSSAYVRRVARIVRLAARHDLYVLLDMHQDLWSERFQGNGAPEWATKDDGQPFQRSDDPFPLNYLQPAVGRAFTNLFENRDGIRTQYARAFAALARRVRGDPMVLGYDLINEPVCELSVPPCALPPPAAAATKWLLPFYRELVPALRRADPTHPPFYEDGVTVNSGYPFLLGARGAPRWPFPRTTALSFHVYCSPLFRPVPCRRQEADVLRNARVIARRNRVAPLITEFGATDDIALLRRQLRAFDAAGFGWQYWQYKTYFDPTTAASSEPGGADAESLVSERGRVKRAKLRVLARAYPERIAGSRASWSFDDRRSVFRLSYRPPRGGEPTVVSLPESVHYRSGYSTRVRGAHAEPQRGGKLALEPEPGARRVTLRVAPAR